MKRLNLSLAVLLTVTTLFFSCKKEEEKVESQTTNTVDLGDSDRDIPVSELKDGISIQNATLETGLPGAPSTDLGLSLDDNSDLAFQGAGLDINLTTTTEVIGAYIRIKDSEDNYLDGFYDVDLTSQNDEGARIGLKKTKRSTPSNARLTVDNEYEIDLDFDESIEPGKFCYEICVYDANLNIGQLFSVCVEVTSWAGNSSIVGKWVFDRSEEEDDSAYTETISCQNDNELEIVRTYDSDVWTLVFNSDGSYYETYYDDKALDYDASAESCSIQYEEDSDKYYGNWSYNSNGLTVVDFGYEDFINPEESEEYEDGDLYFTGAKVEIISGQLVITDEEGDDVDISYFNRK